jgi:hypothetical protein
MKRTKTYEIQWLTGLNSIPTSIVRIKTTSPQKAEAMFRRRYPKREINDIYGGY